MSHITVFMGIPSSKFNGAFDEKKIVSAIEGKMAQYVEETAKEEDVKCDWYKIGGRWAGAIGAPKEAKNIIPTEEGRFAYQFMDQYDALLNDGNRGPYFVDEVEYIPVNAGLKKEIAWDLIEKLKEWHRFRVMEMLFNKDPRLGDNPSNTIITRSDGLYVDNDGSEICLYKKGESFDELEKRIGREFGHGMMQPDAYIDLEGKWHDENEVWATFGENGFPDDPVEEAQKVFMDNWNRFLEEELKDDDCFVVLDCHCFP